MITIRELKPDEWKRFKELRLEALQDSPQAFSDTFEKSSQKSDEAWKNDLERVANGEFLLHFAITDNIPIGSVGAFQREPGIWILYTMFVRKAYRGQKIGEALVREIIVKLKQRQDVKKIRLELHPDQKAAYSMYTKIGFKIIEEKNIKVHEGLEREYLMELVEN